MSSIGQESFIMLGTKGELCVVVWGVYGNKTDDLVSQLLCQHPPLKHTGRISIHIGTINTVLESLVMDTDNTLRSLLSFTVEPPIKDTPSKGLYRKKPLYKGYTFRSYYWFYCKYILTSKEIPKRRKLMLFYNQYSG